MTHDQGSMRSADGPTRRPEQRHSDRFSRPPLPLVARCGFGSAASPAPPTGAGDWSGALAGTPLGGVGRAREPRWGFARDDTIRRTQTHRRTRRCRVPRQRRRRVSAMVGPDTEIRDCHPYALRRDATCVSSPGSGATADWSASLTLAHHGTGRNESQTPSGGRRDSQRPIRSCGRLSWRTTSRSSPPATSSVR